MHGKLSSGEGRAQGRSESGPGAAIMRGCPAWLGRGASGVRRSGPRRGSRKPPLGDTCPAAEVAAAATVAVVAVVAVVGAVAAPPRFARAGPHSPRQGPRAANHSGARGEAPPLPGTSATSEEGERGADAKGKDPGPAALPRTRECPSRAPPRPPAPGTLLLRSRLDFPPLFDQHTLQLPDAHVGKGRQPWLELPAWDQERDVSGPHNYQLALCFRTIVSL